MKIITISGLDGSGKSTQIKMLKNYLEQQGRKVFYFHAVEFSLANKIYNACHRDPPIGGVAIPDKIASSQTPRNDKGKSVTEASWFSIFLRKIFLKVDILRFKKLLKKLEENGYDYLLSDRYFYDSLVNIEYLENIRHCEHNEMKRGDPKIASSQAPSNDIIKPDLSIYLQASPETIMQRERTPDQGLEYLKKKKEIYDAKISLWNWKVIDGNRDKNVIFEEIKKYA